jgi:hypothetical protein
MSTLGTSIVVCALLVVPASMSAAPPNPGAPGGPRVRPGDDRSAALLLEALERSTTMRSLVNRLESSDVIVYIQRQPSLRNRLAGSLTWISAAGGYRYVRVSWSPELSTSAAISTLGHELQHALEIASEASIVSADTMEDFYRKTGISVRDHTGYDTLAARDRGDTVRREIAGVRSTRTTDSLQDVEHETWLAMYRQARGLS